MVVVLPAASFAVQVTIVVHTGNVAGALFVTLATPQLSDVTGVPSVTPVADPHTPVAVFTVTLAGAVIVGACVSATVTAIAVDVATQPPLLVTCNV